VGIVYSSKGTVCATFPAAWVYSCYRPVLGRRCGVVFPYLQYVKDPVIIYYLYNLCFYVGLLFMLTCAPLAADSSPSLRSCVVVEQCVYADRR
jgi:hypothetical protein